MTTTTTTTTTNIPDLVARLQADLVSLGDGRDKKSENEQVTYRRSYDSIQTTISGLRNLPAEVADEQAHLGWWEARRVAYLAKQAEIEQAIEAAPDYRTIDDGRARAREHDRQQELAMSLNLLHDGRLFVAPGVTLGNLGEIDARITELTQRRDRAQSTLDGHLKAAEQLLAVTK